MSDYVHGYSGPEQIRLVDQATTRGVGAQTVTLAAHSPGATIVRPPAARP